MSPVVHPPIKLIPRARDEMLDKEELARLGLFDRLKKMPPVDRFPGSTVLRFFPGGTAITRQGDPGGTAFYILTCQDVTRLREYQRSVLATALPDLADKKLAQARIHELDNELQQQSVAPSTTDEEEAPRAATVYLLETTANRPRPQGLINRVGRLFFGVAKRASKSVLQSIPNDGPTDFDADTRQAPLREGDVFGEMSCMTFAPRSGTVVADVDCYVLELNRPILDHCQKDDGYRHWLDQVYEKRVLSEHLRKLKLFQDLTAEQLDMVRGHAKLDTIEAGTVICDEGDTSDCVYIIRNGLVQVVIGMEDQIKASDVADWTGFCQAMVAAAAAPTTAKSPAVDAPRGPSQAVTGSSVEKVGVVDDVPQAETPNRSVPAKAKSAAQTATETDKPGTPPQGKMSVAAILAAARGNKTAAADADAATDVEAKNKPGKSVPTKASAADILAAARAGKRPASTAESTEETETPAGGHATGGKPKSTSKSTAKVAAGMKGKAATKPDASALLQAARRGKSEQAGSPALRLWKSLSAEAQEAVRRVANSERPDPTDIDIVVGQLRDAMRSREFLSAPELEKPLSDDTAQAAVSAFPKGLKGIAKDWSDVELRIAGRVVMHVLFPQYIPPRTPPSGPPRTLAYLGRGDCVGELGVISNTPRNATCIAYDHPPDDSGRQSGRVELVRIDAQAFRELLEQSPPLREKVNALATRRKEITDQEIRRDPWESQASLLAAPEYRDSGFIQGQKLLLIDLDRCTNCGDCVSACINTHDDGVSRLYLDGPRFDRFLVPSACRNCLNPSCMIGCPVGSIVRGDNGQIEILDWCIGCKQCAEQCPYDSIQMHDIGVIPGADKQQLNNFPGLTEKHHRIGPLVPGWRFMPSSRLTGESWLQPSARDEDWLSAAAPFRWDLDLRDSLSRKAPDRWQLATDICEPICFRYQFDNPLSGAGVDRELRVGVVAEGLTIEVWVNGNQLPPQSDAQRKKGVYEAVFPATRLQRSRNLIAARIHKPGDDAKSKPLEYNVPIFSLRLDLVPERYHVPDVLMSEDEAGSEVKLITERAVVCDLCSSLPSQNPACVAQCPHDAAIRIEARTEFDSLVARSR